MRWFQAAFNSAPRAPSKERQQSTSALCSGIVSAGGNDQRDNGQSCGYSQVAEVVSQVDVGLATAAAQTESYRAALEDARREIVQINADLAEAHSMAKRSQGMEARAKNAEAAHLRCQQEFFRFQTNSVQQIKHLQDVLRMSQNTSEDSMAISYQEEINAAKQQLRLHENTITTLKNNLHEQELANEEEKQALLAEMWEIQQNSQSCQSGEAQTIQKPLEDSMSFRQTVEALENMLEEQELARQQERQTFQTEVSKLQQQEAHRQDADVIQQRQIQDLCNTIETLQNELQTQERAREEEKKAWICRQESDLDREILVEDYCRTIESLRNQEALQKASLAQATDAAEHQIQLHKNTITSLQNKLQEQEHVRETENQAFIGKLAELQETVQSLQLQLAYRQEVDTVQQTQVRNHLDTVQPLQDELPKHGRAGEKENSTWVCKHEEDVLQQRQMEDYFHTIENRRNELQEQCGVSPPAQMRQPNTVHLQSEQSTPVVKGDSMVFTTRQNQQALPFQGGSMQIQQKQDPSRQLEKQVLQSDMSGQPKQKPVLKVALIDDRRSPASYDNISSSFPGGVVPTRLRSCR